MSQTIPQIGGCLGCGYDLRGLTSRQCPECGRAFNPADPATMGPRGLRLGPIGRWATSRVGWAAWVFTGGILLAILWHARFPHEARAHFPIYRFLWPMLIAFWGGRLTAQLLSRVRLRHAVIGSHINVRRTTLVLATGLCIAMAVKDDLVSHAALALSRPAFQRLAVSQPTDVTFSRPLWVGLFRIDGVNPTNPYRGIEGRIYFYSDETDGAFSLSAGSLVYEGNLSDGLTVPFWHTMQNNGD
jgi:hypothetical protein